METQNPTPTVAENQSQSKGFLKLSDVKDLVNNGYFRYAKEAKEAGTPGKSVQEELTLRTGQKFTRKMIAELFKNHESIKNLRVKGVARAKRTSISLNLEIIDDLAPSPISGESEIVENADMNESTNESLNQEQEVVTDGALSEFENF